MLNDSTYKLSDFELQESSQRVDEAKTSINENDCRENMLAGSSPASCDSQQVSSISNDEQGTNAPPIVTPVDASYSLTHSPKVHNETAPQVAGKQKLAPANQLTGKNTGLNSSQLDAGHYYNTTDENTSTIIKEGRRRSL